MRIQVVIGIESVGPEQNGDPGFTRRAAGWFLRPETAADPTLKEIRRMVSSAPGVHCAVAAAERRTGKWLFILRDN